MTGRAPLVVTDTSPLIALSRIGQLHLLPRHYAEVAAPPAVVEEFGEQPQWLVVRKVGDAALAKRLRQVVDYGESEAIALALEMPGAALLVDDLAAREAASRLGIAIIGTFGVLLDAKAAGLLKAVAPTLDALREAGFRASPALIAQVLRLADESEP